MASKKKARATKTARAKKASRSTTKKSSKTTTKKSSTKKATRASRSSTSAAETLWQRIASTDHDDAKRAFATYLALFGDAPADVALIDRIAACFRSAKRAKDSLAVQMTCSDGGDAELTFALPYLDSDELGLPKSVVAALRVANGAGIDRPRGAAPSDTSAFARSASAVRGVGIRAPSLPMRSKASRARSISARTGSCSTPTT